ncbi:MAG: DnaJ domain-containing protein [Spirochaetia bacterium]|nr:DnaJ domain-containing protein [Spirochaetota bacterium]MCX8097171.1 DnaJ domain-containing protein [Spirochaetota bacterium]MDW8112656.1 DnaJ domain-containing protein [Spirochaetia bacterium]
MDESDFKDYYEILEVEYGAPVEKIKTNFRKLAKKYHPDVIGSSDGSIDFKIILEAYKVLTDEKLRESYNKEYLTKKNKVVSKNSDAIKNVIDPSRVEYKLSLLNISKAGFDLSKGFSRQEFLEELGEDLVVYLTDKEIEEGAVLVIQLPARSVCNVCYGANRNCYRCDGTGYITTLEDVKVVIPPGVKHSEVMFVDLKKIKKRRGVTKFSPNDLKIKVMWLSVMDIK